MKKRLTERVIVRVKVNKSNNQKFVYIPKNSDLEEGEYVELSRVV